MTEENIAYFPANSDEWPLIAEGEYQLKLVSHETAVQFLTPKLILLFSICEFGNYFGTRLPKYYNIKKFKGKPGKKGHFYPKRRGDFMFDFYTLFNRNVRLDRIPMEPFYNSIIIGRVGTVKVDYRNRKLPEQMRYSKVCELLRLA